VPYSVQNTDIEPPSGSISSKSTKPPAETQASNQAATTAAQIASTERGSNWQKALPSGSD